MAILRLILSRPEGVLRLHLSPINGDEAPADAAFLRVAWKTKNLHLAVIFLKIFNKFSDLDRKQLPYIEYPDYYNKA